MYKLIFTSKAEKSFASLDKKWQLKIYKVFQSLKENPLKGKKLQGELSSLYSFRVWPYRIIYTIQKEKITLFIVEIGHRQGVYK